MVTPPGNESTETPRVSALSLKALFIGVLCVAATCSLVTYAELVVGKIQIGYMQMPPVVVGILAIMLGGQAVLRRFAPKLGLKMHELYTIYVMMLLASMVSSRGILEKLIPILVVTNYFATAENGWQQKFFHWIPKWAVPWNPDGGIKQFVTARFYDGLRPGEHIPWALWIIPLCAWGVFVALLLFAFLCMAVILRRQWADHERLTFPLVQLPLEMIRGESALPGGSREPFLKNNLTWIGFMIPAVIFGLKGLHQYAPSFPDVTTDFDLNSLLFSQPPYDQVGFFHIYISFMAIGFFYLLPADLLFSLWFFFLLTKVEDLLCIHFGYVATTMPMYGEKTYQGYQIIGCYLTIVGYMFYTARPHLKKVWMAATHLRDRKSFVIDDSNETLPYSVAFWGLICSLLLMAEWLHLLGISYFLALFQVVTALMVIGLIMARSTSEAGMLLTETSFRPIDIYRMVGDPFKLGAQNLTGLAFMDGFMLRDQRGLVLSGFLDSMKLADGVHVRRRSLIGVFALSLVVALAISGWMQISLPYRLGAIQMYGYVYSDNPVRAFHFASSTLSHTLPGLHLWDIFNFVLGIAVTIGMVTLRSQLAGFPFHPLGYALSGSWTMMVFWFPCLIAWLLKTLILRYGGMKLYSQMRPLFLGMVLGEIIMAVLFTAPALVNRYTPTPNFPWP